MSLCSLVGIWTPGTRVVLSGDPKQLSAVIKSEGAASLGLDMSLMERLMNLNSYDFLNGSGLINKSIQGNLTKNFRSNDKILKLFSSLCYDDKLEAFASPKTVDFALEWKFLPNPHIPVMFDPVYVNSFRGDRGQSYGNYGEIAKVRKYVKELLTNGLNGKSLNEIDIGIVTPYAVQVDCIKNELRRENITKIEVGSAEVFQGKERKVMIISCVRSKTRTLGFLRNIRVSCFLDISVFRIDSKYYHFSVLM